MVITVSIIVGILVIGWGSNMLKRSKGIYSPLDETIIGVLEGEKLEKAFQTQKKKKALKFVGNFVSIVGGWIILCALGAIAMGLPEAKVVYGWISVVMISTGSLLMYLGGDKPSGGDGIKIALPSLKQVFGLLLWVCGVALLIGLSIGN